MIECETGYNTEKKVWNAMNSTKGEALWSISRCLTGITYSWILKRRSGIPVHSMAMAANIAKDGSVFSTSLTTPPELLGRRIGRIKHLLDLNGGSLEGKKIRAGLSTTLPTAQSLTAQRKSLAKARVRTFAVCPLTTPVRNQKSQWFADRRKSRTTDHVRLGRDESGRVQEARHPLSDGIVSSAIWLVPVLKNTASAGEKAKRLTRR